MKKIFLLVSTFVISAPALAGQISDFEGKYFLTNAQDNQKCNESIEVSSEGKYLILRVLGQDTFVTLKNGKSSKSFSSANGTVSKGLKWSRLSDQGDMLTFSDVGQDILMGVSTHKYESISQLKMTKKDQVTLTTGYVSKVIPGSAVAFQKVVEQMMGEKPSLKEVEATLKASEVSFATACEYSK